MDLALSEFQQLLRDNARAILEQETVWPALREVTERPPYYAPATWRRLAEQGWLGLGLPEELGGAGGTLSDVGILWEEIGRVVLPSPFTSTWLGGQAVARFAHPPLQQEVLPALVRGERILALAWYEAAGRLAPEHLHLTIEHAGSDLILTGEKRFVRDGLIADELVVLGSAPEGPTAVLVPADAPGLTRLDMHAIAHDRQAVVRFDRVRVPTERLLGNPGQGWDLVAWLLPRAILAECAELTGVGERVLEMSVEYAKNRVQFGRPIGSFQAIQHKCADMVTDVDGCRLITRYAIWRLESGQPARTAIARAKAWVSDAIRRIVREGHQIHAGIGFILETPLHRYFLRAKSGELFWGAAPEHYRQIGEAVTAGVAD